MTNFRAELEAKEAKRYADNILDVSKCHIEDGVARWTSNGSCVPSDILQKAILAEPCISLVVNVVKHEAARRAEISAFLQEYRETQEEHQRKVEAGDPEACAIEAENQSEMRAAFGEGTTVVNVITGRKTYL